MQEEVFLKVTTSDMCRLPKSGPTYILATVGNVIRMCHSTLEDIRIQVVRNGLYLLEVNAGEEDGNVIRTHIDYNVTV